MRWIDGINSSSAYEANRRAGRLTPLPTDGQYVLRQRPWSEMVRKERALALATTYPQAPDI